MSPEGYVDVVDRMDDLVKSGGEWIASVEVENAVMGHDEVVEAAVVPVPHERWDERPAAFVVTRDAVSDEAALRQEIKDLVAESYPSWWVPDAIRLVDGIPKGATGKFSKQTLRDEYVDESVIELSPRTPRRRNPTEARRGIPAVKIVSAAASVASSYRCRISHLMSNGG